MHGTQLHRKGYLGKYKIETKENLSRDREIQGKYQILQAYQYLPTYENEDDMVYVDSAEIWAIIPVALPLNLKFEITSTMIQLFNLRGVFANLPTDDANLHRANFIGIFNFYNISGVDMKVLRLKLFPQFLYEEDLVWLADLPQRSLTMWNKLHKQFFDWFFPP